MKHITKSVSSVKKFIVFLDGFRFLLSYLIIFYYISHRLTDYYELPSCRFKAHKMSIFRNHGLKSPKILLYWPKFKI